VHVNIGRLRLLLVAWVILVLAPGVIATLAFGLDANSGIPGGVAGVWIGGYLVQFGTFMAVTRTSKQNDIAGWFVASLLPWACDWTTPVRLWAIAPCAAVAIGTAWLIYHSAVAVDALEHKGVRATGAVLGVVKPMFNVVINNVYIRRTLRVRVERADGIAPYEARIKGLFMLGEVPSQGDRLALRVDPAKPQRIKIVDASDAAPASAPDADGDVPAPASFRMHHVPSHQSTDGQTDLAEELDKLARLHASGGLSDEEFAQAKARILRA
jgi:hypothetical protein